ncbi:La-domain-containing protein [Anaeromyces robustus]|uniref:La-domain-containing protein n=1 Tax=Anaeromyces robustus TaxID=1754192 RepID=A0A1Y1XQ33_9FUNG|nr:La-domain-containing protein [Anaeromyces robustus]|eukprot:ORX87870.1 La-domain-containing protein [Anaeromyces robustus]
MTEAKVLKQIEYYFSDSNLPKDKFLWETVNSDPQGWVEIDTLLKFNRLKSLTTDHEIIKNAIKQSKELLELNEDGTKVRRKIQIKPKSDDVIERSIYVQGIPTSINKPVEAIEKYLAEYGIEHVHINAFRNKNRSFKGEAFIELKTKEDAETIISKKLPFEGTEINIMKKSEFPNLKQKKKLTRQLSYLPSLVPDEEKEDWEAIEKKNKEQEQEIIESDTKKFNESAVISFNLTEAVPFNAVKNFLTSKGNLTWVNYHNDSTTGGAFFEESDVEALNEKINKQKIDDTEVEITSNISTDDEKKALLEAFLEFRQKMRKRNGGKFKRNNKRKAEDAPEGEPETKQEKNE